jgi:hypothetical protein
MVLDPPHLYLDLYPASLRCGQCPVSFCSTAVVKNISKTIKLFCVKCEQAIKGDSDASQVIGRRRGGGQTDYVPL